MTRIFFFFFFLPSPPFSPCEGRQPTSWMFSYKLIQVAHALWMSRLRYGLLFTANCPKVAAKLFIFLVPTRCLRHYLFFPTADCPTVHSPKTSIFWPSQRDIHISRPVRRDKNKSQLDNWRLEKRCSPDVSFCVCITYSILSNYVILVSRNQVSLLGQASFLVTKLSFFCLA